MTPVGTTPKEELPLNSMPIGEALDLIQTLLECGIKVCLEGDTGVGKTRGAETLPAKMGYDGIIVLHLAQLMDVDVRGFVDKDANGHMVWRPYGPLAEAGTKRFVILLDEYNRALQSTRNAAMQLVRDKRVGDLVLHPDTCFIATINPTKGISGGGTTKLNQAEEATFTTINIVPSVPDWLRWALTHNIHPCVYSFIKSRPEFLNCPVREGKGSNPRAWEKISDMVWKSLSDKNMLVSVIGTVGKEAGIPFMGHYKIWKQMPDKDLILAAPTQAPVPDESGTRYAIAASLVSNVTEKNFGKAITYCMRLGKEYCRFMTTAATLRNPDLCTTPEYQQYTLDNPS